MENYETSLNALDLEFVQTIRGNKTSDVIIEKSNAKRAHESPDVLREIEGQVVKKVCVQKDFEERENLLTKPFNRVDFSSAHVPKKTSNLFLVEINMGNCKLSIRRSDIYKKLRAVDDSLECLVSLHDESSYVTNVDSKLKFQILVDTSNTKKKRFELNEIYNWIYGILINFGESIKTKITIYDAKSASENGLPSITIQIPKDRCRAIRKCTEYDYDPMYTVLFSDHDKFSENYKIEQWARRKKGTAFDMFDEFVRNPGLIHSVGYLRSYLEQKQKHQVHMKKSEDNKTVFVSENLSIIDIPSSASLISSVDCVVGTALNSTRRTNTGTIECITSILNRSLSFDQIKN